MHTGLRGSRTISVPRLLHVKAGAFEQLPAALAETFDPSRVVIAAGGATSGALADRLATGLKDLCHSVEVHAGLVGSLAEAARLLDILDESPTTLVVAVGGGQPIDVAKLAACRAGVDLVAVPTILSHDGMASPVASLAGSDGARRSLGARMPAGVVIDLDVVGAAPDRYVRAGIGDLTSNLTAVDDWQVAQARGGEPYDEFAASIALLSAKAALEVGWPLVPDDLAAIAGGLVMSGLAMEVAGSSRPCSGAEHLISHALDYLRGTDALLHGEHVAIGVLVASVLQNSPHVERIRSLFERVGLPVTLHGWGVEETTLVQAVQMGPTTRPGRRTVLDDVDLSTESITRVVRTALRDGP
jgi:glycerol-1-phosphate dehydrogenase [NAD(P)+]